MLTSRPSAWALPSWLLLASITAGAADPLPDGMVWVPGGTFAMGTDRGQADARPVHQVTVSGFWMDATEVTNAAYARFVAATGYVTVAERPPKAADIPAADASLLVPGSLVFMPTDRQVALDDAGQWWRFVPGADWRHPRGPASGIAGCDAHPAVHIAWTDAAAYAAWAGKRLPTEAEWEFAARGGLAAARYAWGDEQTPGGRWVANIWQGMFPKRDDAVDGFAGTAPVASFPPNAFGLYDLSGNVWEWCSDWYRPDAYALSTPIDPQGPAESLDPDEPGVPKRVQRGGSFLCSDVYCVGYLPSTRMKCSPDTGLCHAGFRCVRSR
jgi:formylglycine-generating enzyme